MSKLTPELAQLGEVSAWQPRFHRRRQSTWVRRHGGASKG